MGFRRAALAASLLTVACGPGPPGPPPECASISAVVSRDEGWRRDVRCVVATIETRHPAPFASVSRAEFDAAARALSDAIPTITNQEVAVRLMSLAAMLRDGHTNLFSAASSSRWLALLLRRFPEGLYAVAASPGDGAWLGGRVVAIGGLPIDEVRARVAALIPQENEASVAAFETDVLGRIEVLQGIGAADPSVSHVEVMLEAPGGGLATATLSGLSGELTWYPASRPRSLGRTDVEYWSEIEPETRTLYIQYNACSDRRGLPMSDFAAQVQQTLKGSAVDRVVLDLRWNGGGSSLVNEPLEAVLRAWPGSRDPARFTVLIGPGTLSSAMWAGVDLRASTAARVIGETSGNNPQGPGDRLLQELPYSKLELSFSTKLFHRSEDLANRLAPDDVVPWGWADYAGRVDPVLVAAGMTGR